MFERKPFDVTFLTRSIGALLYYRFSNIQTRLSIYVSFGSTVIITSVETI